MTKKFMVAAILLLALSASARQIGQDHNRLLDCLLRQDPHGQMGVAQTLQTLVDRCRFNPGMSTGEFVKKYSRLVPRAILTGGDIDLARLAQKHSRNFTQQQLNQLRKVQSIIRTRPLMDAARTLKQMHRNESSRLRAQSNESQAVLAAMDIGASSAKFWAQKSQNSYTLAKWWQVVLGDVAGGVVGGIFGGGVGAVGLGTACSKLVAEKT